MHPGAGAITLPQIAFQAGPSAVRAGGTGNKAGAGALNYRISLKLPYDQRPENKYGLVQQQAYEAQRLLTCSALHNKTC